MSAQSGTVATNIPFRLDRLPWSRWHWLVVISLGVTWILDGLEVTILGSIGSVLKDQQTLHLTDAQVGLAGTLYLLGAVTGALFFGYLTDRLGRKRLFLVTLAVYLVFTTLSGFAFNFWSFGVLRFLAGTGIGGEYSAINSAIDELIPARVRGWVDLAVNGSWWIGTSIAAGLSLIVLNENLVPVWLGWRLAFFIGALLALTILLIRRAVPESPRWLLTHGRAAEAEEVVCEIEAAVRRSHPELPPVEEKTIEIDQRASVGFLDIARTLLRDYPGRTVLGASLMAGQAFFYNAIFFTESLVLTTFFGVEDSHVGYYIFPFAVGNILGPWLLGRLFDTVGRRTMIAGTYIVSGVLLIGTGVLFTHHALSATTITICWSVIFFFASAGASAAYLTVSELFPMEIRAMAIALFFAFGTGVGGSMAPALFGWLIASKDVSHVFYGYLLGAVLMIGAGLVAAVLAVNAERRSLEDVARPLSAIRERLADTASVPARAR